MFSAESSQRRPEPAGPDPAALCPQELVTPTGESWQASRGPNTPRFELLGRLTDGIAHDFNNALAAIVAHAELARGSLPPQHPAARSLEGIMEAARQAAAVTSALLSFRRGACAAPRAVSLNRMVTATVRLLRRILRSTIQWHVDLPEDVPATVSGDPIQLQQVVIALLLSAQESMPDGGSVSLRLTCEDNASPSLPGAAVSPGAAHPPNEPQADRQAAPRAILEVAWTVRDGAHGGQGESASRQEDHSFPVGPAMLEELQRIIDSHGGQLHISVQPAGTTLARVSLPAAPDGTSARLELVAGRPVGAGELVLVAEDHEQVREVVAAGLTGLGFRVLRAADGRALLREFAAHRDEIALLIIDLELPRRSGLAALRELRAAGCATPAILVSGYVATEAQEDLDDRTVLLRKPFQLAELGALAARLLGRPWIAAGRTLL